jgi:hypothetical protein
LKKTYSFALIFFILLPIISFSQVPEGVDFSIRFYDKEIYYPESDIQIKAIIANNTGQTFRFKLAEQRMFSIDFDALTLKNQVLEHSQKFITERNANQQVYYREVSIEPGEQYSFVENISDYIDFPGSGIYIISAKFYPELYKNMSSMAVRSNKLTLSVRPSAEGIEAVQDRIDQATGEILRAESLSPDEVVRYMLRARQRGEWDKFFLYLDMESLLRNNPARENRYIALSEEEQRRMLEEFKEDLKQQVVDSDIVVIPEDFEIIRTTYTPDFGQVEVREEFQNVGYVEIKKYIYYLERHDEIWNIYNYDVINLGTR